MAWPSTRTNVWRATAWSDGPGWRVACTRDAPSGTTHPVAAAADP